MIKSTKKDSTEITRWGTGRRFANNPGMKQGAREEEQAVGEEGYLEMLVSED